MNTVLSLFSTVYAKLEGLFNRYSRYVPLTSFFAGFSWDSATLHRIDNLADNLLFLSYIILLGTSIVVLNMVNAGRVKQPFLLTHHEWLPVIIQFLFGGLFSAYVIYYFQSATFNKTGIFVLMLFGLLIANEFLKSRLTNIYLQMALYFLVSFSFFIFFLPVMTRMMHLSLFFASGLISLSLVLGMLYLLFRCTAIKSKAEFRRIGSIICGLYLLLNFFYWMNWIPPVPLSAKFSGVCHNVQKMDDLYQLSYEKPDWFEFYRSTDDEFHYVSGDTVYCFAAIFAPEGLQTRIFYHWQYYSESSGSWVTTDRVGYTINGGRDGGYRGYTHKKNIESDGEWRIDIETGGRRTIKRVEFTIIKTDSAGYKLETEFR